MRGDTLAGPGQADAAIVRLPDNDGNETNRAIAITTHPGKASGEQTTFYHRPLGELLTAIGQGGLAVTACEELYSHRRSQTGGPFSKAEHHAAQEFPLFLALTLRRF